jgi:hypothetical protein
VNMFTIIELKLCIIKVALPYLSIIIFFVALKSILYH